MSRPEELDWWKGKRRKEETKRKGKIVEEEIPLEDAKIMCHIDWAGLDVSQYFKKLQIKDALAIFEEIEESEAPPISKILGYQTTTNWKTKPTPVKIEFC